jgi:formylmethanofuran dehydrogenase subunit B
MAEARIAGRDASLDEAVAAAASLLRASRCAAIAGLGTDVAGAEAAIALARQVGGAFDHRYAAAALRDLDVMREAGWTVATMPQARALAELVLLVGRGQTWDEIAHRLRLAEPPPLAPDRPRRVIRLCPGVQAPAVLGGAAVETVGTGAEELPVLLGLLRAEVAGRRHSGGMPALSAVAEALRNARYAVAVWSAAEVDALSVEMLGGLIEDLNRRKRAAGLPLAPGDNAAGVAQAGAWHSGYPLRVGFGRGRPEHDPWRFDAARLVASGEADAAVWISSFAPDPPPWQLALPTIALVAEGTSFATPPDVAITVGRPLKDHDTVLFDADMGTIAARYAADARALPTVADVLARIAGLLAC